MTLRQLPDLVVHADWSKSAQKRWMAQAVRQPGGEYSVSSPAEVGDLATLFDRLRAAAGSRGLILAGFDFPIGLPADYAEMVGVVSFLEVLPRLGQAEWRDFYNPAASSAEISLQRPFYPASPGKSKREHLSGQLGIPFESLRRTCEKPYGERGAACPLFWTMGAQQVGKAAICGWRDLLAPALRLPRPDLYIWPFSASLAERPLEVLLQPGRLVVAETYPAEYYRPLGIDLRKTGGNLNTRLGKGSAASRQANTAALLDWAAHRSLELSPALRAEVSSGFAGLSSGDDRFDALVGLFGMLQTLFSDASPDAPPTSSIRSIEGWILGQPAPSE